MAKQRYIDTRFWDDSYIIDLKPKRKLLFLYFLTNPLTNIAGIYEVSIDRISFDTGLEKKEIKECLKEFQIAKKVYYVDSWIILANFPKYQNFISNEKIRTGIDLILSQIPDTLRKAIDRLSIPYTYPSNYSNYNPNYNPNPNASPDRLSGSGEIANPRRGGSKKIKGEKRGEKSGKKPYFEGDRMYYKEYGDVKQYFVVTDGTHKMFGGDEKNIEWLSKKEVEDMEKLKLSKINNGKV